MKKPAFTVNTENTEYPTPASLQHTTGNPMLVQKCGWLEKEIATAYKMLVRFKPRYLVLTAESLTYYHHFPDHVALPAFAIQDDKQKYPSSPSSSSAAGKREAGTEVALSSINESFLMQSAHKEPEFIHIKLNDNEHVYRFRANNAEDALSWRMAIMMLLGKLSPTSTKVHFERGATITFPTKHTPDEEQEILDSFSSLCQLDDLVASLEDCTCSTSDQAKFVANLFFESLAKLPAKERNLRAKEMGKSLVAWLEMDGIAESRTIPSLYDKERSSKLEILTVWLRVALSREFFSSCKFEENGANNDEGDVSSESSSMTHSTVKSRMKNIRRGTIIMPFRADTVECLFISSIIHNSSIKDNLLFFILHPVLRPIANNPDNFTYPKVTIQAVNTVTSDATPAIPHTISASSAADDASAEKGARGGLVKRSSKRFMGLVRGAFGLQQPLQRTNSFNSLSHTDERPQSIDRSTAQAFSQHYQNLHGQNKGVDHDISHLNIHELQLLSPIELKRLEVRKCLLEVASNIADKLMTHSELRLFPVAVATIIRTIRDLIIHTPKDYMEFSTMASKASNANSLSRPVSSSDLNEDEAEQLKSRKRFEYGTYFTSCSALLFLRLICRAIISPDDYGVTDKLVQNVYDRVASNTIALPSRALPAMAILAHTLLLPEPTSEDQNEVKVIGQQPKRDHMDRSDVLHMFSIIDRVNEKVSHKDAVQTLEVFQAKKFNLSTAEIHYQEQLHSSKTIECGDMSSYNFDFMKPSTRWALAEVAKSMQHIANISCLPKEEMHSFARESLILQNIAAGTQDKDSYDTHVLTGYETETILSQIEIASRIKQVYEKIGELPNGNW